VKLHFRRTAAPLITVTCLLAVAAPALAQSEAPTSTGGASPESAPTTQPTAPASSTPAAGPSAVRTLKPGMRGRRVRSLQRRLGIRVDGVYGRTTKRAVIRFQRRKRLTVDGIAGPATLRALGLVPKTAAKGPVQSKNPPAKVTLPDSIPAKAAAVLERIAECESGGVPTAVSPNGTYRGKYQFHVDTWAAMGGSGDPAAAPEDEQDKRAYVLYDRQGTDPWPVCGPKATSTKD
jgi:peptidoglycan hydrolase-like protein with peptidoglycan-binding domain